MLSPASLRVCCLAVMAPALTKAVRQADCLPYCVSGTTNSYPEKSDSAISNDENLRSPTHSMRDDRAWCKPPLRCGLLLKPNSLVSQNSPILLLNGRNRANAELKAKGWHGTKFAAAISAKIRFKTTMNRNSSPTVKNMGLAKANTSLSFQSPKKIQRILPVTHTSVLTTKMQRILHLPEKPLDVLDTSTASDNCVLVSPLSVSTCREISVSKLDGVGTICPAIVSPLSTCTRADEVLPSTSQTVITISTASTDTTNISTPVNMSTVVPDVVPNTCTILPHFENGATRTDSDSQSSAPCSVVSNPPQIPIVLDVPTSIAAGTLTVTNTSSNVSLCECTVSPTPMDVSESSDNTQYSSFPKIACSPSVVSKSPEPDSSQSDSTPLSEPSTSSGIRMSPKMSMVRFSKKSREACKELAADSNGKIVIISPTSKLQLSSTHRTAVPLRKLEAFKEQYEQSDRKARELLSRTLDLKLRHLNHHVKLQLRGFVEHYQKKLGVPCQRQIRPNACRRNRDAIDLKSELLQSENVRSLSTAALVSLVRKMESSPEKYLTQPRFSTTSDEPEPESSSENVVVEIDPAEYENIKHVSRKLMADIRHLLSSTDPDLTEDSSADESCDEFEFVTPTEELAGPKFHNRAVWKWANERAAMASRWTWLIAKVHDLEYHLRLMSEVLKQVRVAKGGVCFEEPVVLPESDALSTTPIADNTSLQTTPTKQTTLKDIIKPLNGYLGHAVSEDSSSVQGISAYPSTKHHQQESGSDEAEPYLCSRTQPLNIAAFRKRKLFTTSGFHQTNTCTSRLSTVGCSCNCQSTMLPCMLCGGRYNTVQSVDPDTMPLLERVSLLDPCFHPVLSFVKDLPLHFHFVDNLKKKEAYYQSLTVHSPVIKKPRLGAKPKSFSNIRNHSRKLKRYGLLSAKYRNKHVQNTNRHLRKRGLIFGKWRKLQKSSLRRVRRFSIASSCSSRDSPVPSPSSLLDDSYGFDHFKKRRDDNQFDIDNVIIPCNSKSGRLEKLQYKEIEIPSWRYMDIDATEPAEDEEGEEEDISDALYAKRYDRLEIEERKILRGAAMGFAGTSRRGRRQHRCDSRADSSGANTPDPVLLYQQDIVFQDPNSIITGGPISPALSPPATPGSATAMSDDSQPSFGNGSSIRTERRRTVSLLKRDKPYEESIRVPVSEHVYIPPYEPRVYPLSDREYEEMLKESTHFNDEPDLTQNGMSCPASPASSSESTSTVEEDDDDITDPEWTVVKRENGPEQTLVLKFAKR